MTSALYWIKALELEHHPEGGYYKEVYRSADIILSSGLNKRYDGNRSALTSIYYLLDKTNISHFHRVNSDETWHYYQGSSSIELIIISPSGELSKVLLGANFSNGEQFQFTVRQNCWFAAYLTDNRGFALVGCTVAPGFEFADFYLAEKEELAKQFPQHILLIEEYCY